MKILILTAMLAPYRVDVFNELGKLCELTVCFEMKTEEGRNADWYKSNIRNFKAIFLKKWGKPRYYLKLEILKYIKKESIDIAVAYEYSSPTALLFMSTCLIRNIPYAINCDGGFTTSTFLISSVKKFFISRARACLAGGEFADKYFTFYGATKDNIYRHNFTSLFNGDIKKNLPSKEEKACIREELGISYEKVVISVGNYIYRKGFDVLLKACKNLPKSYGIYLIGGQPTSEYLQLKEDYQLDNVIFVGFKKKKELEQYYISADLFVLPTRYDIWGLVVNEAMAYGLPVITTDKCIAGLELVKNGENGFIVKTEDIVELQQKIMEVLENNELKESMSIKSLDKIKDFTIENIAKAHYDTFRTIIGGKISEGQ